MECYDCENHGTCEESQVQIAPYNCLTHRFTPQPPEINRDGIITKLRWHCEHCWLPLAVPQVGLHKDCMLFGRLADL